MGGTSRGKRTENPVQCIVEKELYIHDVPHHSPHKEQNNISACQERMLHDTHIFFTLPEILQARRDDQRKCIGNTEDKEIVVGQSLGKTAMQQGMKSSLEATCRTAPPCEHTERTLRHPCIAGGVEQRIDHNSPHHQHEHQYQPNEGIFRLRRTHKSWSWSKPAPFSSCSHQQTR